MADKEKQARKLIDFITRTHRDHFRLPVCRCYCKYGTSKNKEVDLNLGRANKISEDDCVCGRKEDANHGKEASRPKSPYFAANPYYWTINRNTDKDASSSFGEMEFIDLGDAEVEGSRAKYLRLPGFRHNDEDSKVDLSEKVNKYKEALRSLMLGKDYWAMPRPRLVIEVTGTALDKDVESADYRVIETLKAGLVNAARESDAWIVTGGSHCGVMRLIGDEVAKLHRLDITIPCLGIATWGIVKNRRALKHEFDNMIKKYELTARYEMNPSSLEYGTFLNNGHNYFLLVDNGREKIFGEEIDFRHELIHHLSENLSGTSSMKAAVPIVMLALGGGIGTLATFEDCFGIKDTSITTPVVILYGFGGATDVLADAYAKFLSGVTTDKISQEIQKHPQYNRGLVENKDKYQNDHDRKAAEDATVERVIHCLERAKEKNLLTVVREFQAESLSSAILQTAMRHHTPIMTLQLARLWNAPEAAENLLREKTTDIKQAKEIHKLVREAVAYGQVNFVSLFLNYKLIERNEFLSSKEVFKIYKNTLYNHQSFKGIGEASLLSDLSKCAIDTAEGRFRKLGSVFADHIGCFFLNPFREDGRYNLAVAQFNKKTYSSKANGFAIHFDAENKHAKSNGFVANNQKQTQMPTANNLPNYRDVFLLQLALNQKEMAVYLWKNGRELIGTALMASIFLANLSETATKMDRHSLSKVYADASRDWENRAKCVLQKCDELRQSKVSWLLNRKLLTWQGRSVFEIAFYGNCMHFVQHSAVQRKLTHIWYGRISSFTRSIWVYLVALLPVFAVFLNVIPYDSSGKLNLKKAKAVEVARANQITAVENETAETMEETAGHDGNKKYEVDSKRRCISPRQFFESLLILYRSTMVRFFGQVVCMVLFLLVFTSFILAGSLNPSGVTLHEGFVLALSICFLIDILHETYSDDIAVVSRMKTISLGERVSVFFKTAVFRRFNILSWRNADFYCAIIPAFIGVLLLISFILRMVLDPVDYIYPRTTYALTCLCFWIRSMRVFYVSSSIGIIVAILSELLPTLFSFLTVYIFLLLAFSIPIYALISPSAYPYGDNNSTTVVFHDNTPWPFKSTYPDGVRAFIKLFLRVIYNRWWNLVQFDLDNSRQAVEGVCGAGDGTKRPITSLPDGGEDDASCHEEFNFVAIVLYIVFIFMTNIAWMNVLIATLSDQVGQVQQGADKLSKFNYLVAVRSAYYRCALPPPLSVIEIFVRGLRSKKSSEDVDFLDDTYRRDALRKLDELERYCAEFVLEKEAAEQKKQSAS